MFFADALSFFLLLLRVFVPVPAPFYRFPYILS